MTTTKRIVKSARSEAGALVPAATATAVEAPGAAGGSGGPATEVTLLGDSNFDGETHYGLSINVSGSNDTKATLMVPDAGKGEKEVYLTAPLELDLTNLNKFFQAKNIKLPDVLSGLLKHTTLKCDALYTSTDKVSKEDLTGEDAAKAKSKVAQALGLDVGALNDDWIQDHPNGIDLGAFLLMIGIRFNVGLTKALTGDDSLEKLFSIESGAIRVLRCPPSKKQTLTNYVELLGKKN